MNSNTLIVNLPDDLKERFQVRVVTLKPKTNMTEIIKLFVMEFTEQDEKMATERINDLRAKFNIT